MRPERKLHVRGTGTITFEMPAVAFRTTAAGVLEILRHDPDPTMSPGSTEVVDAFAPGAWVSCRLVDEP